MPTAVQGLKAYRAGVICRLRPSYLGNGARVEQINWAADMSGKGIKQSYGLMVNYLYDLRKIDRHRQALAQGRVPVSDAVSDLYF